MRVKTFAAGSRSCRVRRVACLDSEILFMDTGDGPERDARYRPLT